MPDVTGADRMPHAYADMLASLRQGLLDSLPGQDAGQRQPPPITVTKQGFFPPGSLYLVAVQHVRASVQRKRKSSL
jgi:hypothetical protein